MASDSRRDRRSDQVQTSSVWGFLSYGAQARKKERESGLVQSSLQCDLEGAERSGRGSNQELGVEGKALATGAMPNKK